MGSIVSLRTVRRTVSAIAGEHLSQMYGAARGVLPDLFAATEAVADEQIVSVGGADGGQQHRSASVCDTSNLSRSKPKGPAMPQQPESSSSTSAPVARSRLISSSMVIERLLVAVAVDDDAPSGIGGGCQSGVPASISLSSKVCRLKRWRVRHLGRS